MNKCTHEEEAGAICFLIEALQADGWKRLVYLERHHADLTRDSCFFLRTHSLESTLSASRLFCRTVFGCWRRRFADIITVGESAELILCSQSCAEARSGRWRALPSAHGHLSERCRDWVQVTEVHLLSCAEESFLCTCAFLEYFHFCLLSTSTRHISQANIFFFLNYIYLIVEVNLQILIWDYINLQ